MSALLLAMSVIPGIFLLYQVWKLDTIEKEPRRLLVKLFIWGAVMALPIIVVELTFEETILTLFESDTYAYWLVENFIGVALVEEFGKYIATKKCTWKHPAFDYHFDGIIYAICASMGFAILENIMYVLDGGLGTAIIRAVLSIPGHAIFALFMGNYYSKAKAAELAGEQKQKKKYLRRAVLVPMLYHGFYDFCLSAEEWWLLIVFLVFVSTVYYRAFRNLKQYSLTDHVLAETEEQEIA